MNHNQNNRGSTPPNDQDLWSLLNGEPASAPVQESSRPHHQASCTGNTPNPVNSAPRKASVNGPILACMAGVAAVSVAATLLIGGIFGGSKTPPATEPPVSTTPAIVMELEAQNAALVEENAALKNENDDLQKQLLALQAELEELEQPAEQTTDPTEENQDAEATDPTDPTEENQGTEPTESTKETEPQDSQDEPGVE